MTDTEKPILVCAACGARVPDLEDPKSWQPTWRLDATGELVGREASRHHGSAYVGYTPKPEFKHACPMEPRKDKAQTPSSFLALTFEELLRHTAKTNDEKDDTP